MLSPSSREENPSLMEGRATEYVKYVPQTVAIAYIIIDRVFDMPPVL